MAKYNSDGEVFGSKALTLAVIAVSATVLAGMVFSPAVTATHAKPAQPVIEQVVVKAPATTPVSG